MKLFIGSCTYNRKKIIEHTSKSLSEIDGIEEADIYIYDDCSTEYDIGYLKKLYPMAKEINRSDKNLGADFNTKRMYKAFLKSDCDYLFNADSDLVFNENVLKIIKENIKNLENANKGVIFSLINIPEHKYLKDFDENLCYKYSVGAGGVIFSRSIVELFIDKLPEKYTVEIPSIDHAFCKILRENNYDIFCSKKSYLQHIGLIGQNSFGLRVDWGKDFVIDTITNANATVNVLENYIINDVPDNICKLCEDGKVGAKTILKALLLCIKYKIKRFKSKLKG